MNVKENQQLCSIIFLIKKTISGAKSIVYEELVEELYRALIPKSKEEEYMQDLKRIFGSLLMLIILLWLKDLRDVLKLVDLKLVIE